MTQTPALNLKSSEREYFVSKIRSGIYTVKYNDIKLKILQPTIEQEFELNEIYLLAYTNAYNDGIKTEEQVVEWMINKGLWSYEEDDKIEKIKKDIDRLKKEIFNAKNNFKLRETIRTYIRTAESAMQTLKEKRSLFYSNTCEGIATNEKMHSFLTTNTFVDDKNHDFTTEPSLEYMAASYYSQILPEKYIRYLARTEPWRSLWLLNNNNLINLFNKNNRELSIDQRNIVVWSKMYDSVYESMETPSDFVIEDDDMLDGWFIVQKEKSEKRKNDNELEMINSKFNKADEVFLVANSQEDVQRIHSMNDVSAQKIKTQREKFIQQRGAVQQHEFADEQLRLSNMAREQFKSNFRR